MPFLSFQNAVLYKWFRKISSDITKIERESFDICMYSHYLFKSLILIFLFIVSSTRNWGLAEDLPEIDDSIVSSRRLRSNVDDDDEVIY